MAAMHMGHDEACVMAQDDVTILGDPVPSPQPGRQEAFMRRAKRADCDMRWADTSDGDVGDPVTIALNEMQDQRAVILDRAISVLVADLGLQI
jgi:hypothetical protein